MSRIDWTLYDHRLGVDMDTVIAEEAGCSSQGVASRRKKLGIPAAPIAQTARVRQAKTPAYLHLLGTKSDATIALEFNCSTPTVLRWRTKMGISAVTTAPLEKITDEQWARMTFNQIGKIAGVSHLSARFYHAKHKRHIARRVPIAGSKGRAA